MTSDPRALVVALALAACGGPPPQPGPAPKADAPKADAPKADAPKAAPVEAGPKLATVKEDVPLPLTAFLGKDPPTAEKKLGEPQAKGLATTSCVRFVPERVFFACKHALQRYPDPTGSFTAVHLEVEDGVVTAVGFEGWKGGQGPVEPAPLLAAIGLELPEPPLTDSPETGVRRWAWFNHLARLRIEGRQYRVEMSVIGDDWARSRIDVILNDPLTDAQKAAVLQPKAPTPPDP